MLIGTLRETGVALLRGMVEERKEESAEVDKILSEKVKFEKENVEIFYYKRKIHDYDFLQTSCEWSFLDNIKPFKKKRDHISFKLFGYRIKVEWKK